MAPYRQPKRLGRVAGSAIGAMAIKVYECNGCGAQYDASKPAQCRACGRMDFTKIDSKTEAIRMGELRLLERAGIISELQFQVRFPLMAFCLGNPVKVGEYIADATYRREGNLIIEDTKGAVVSDVAAFKLRFMAAMGLPVKIVQPRKG